MHFRKSARQTTLQPMFSALRIRYNFAARPSDRVHNEKMAAARDNPEYSKQTDSKFTPKGAATDLIAEMCILNDVIKRAWETHDFKVKMLDWSGSRGSRLAYTCRLCGRKFCLFTISNQGTWAVDGEGRALQSTVSDRWLAESCPRLLNTRDDEDRKLLSKLSTQ
jgi:hypothetical protein